MHGNIGILVKLTYKFSSLWVCEAVSLGDYFPTLERSYFR